MPNVKIVKYCRHLKQHGIWGNHADYPKLFDTFNA